MSIVVEKALALVPVLALVSFKTLGNPFNNLGLLLTYQLIPWVNFSICLLITVMLGKGLKTIKKTCGDKEFRSLI